MLAKPLSPEVKMMGEKTRKRLVQEILPARGIRDPRVLDALYKVPRHLFVAEALANLAYSEATLPIGDGQTLSQPYTVARMSEALELSGQEEVLEIGTGSGYQTAVLALLCQKVYTIERLASLGDSARRRLRQLGYHNVVYRVGDGSMGWPEDRLFDRIIVTAGAPVIPKSLTEQLKPGGILILPRGGKENQELVRIEKSRTHALTENVLEACCFVPLVGAQGWKES